MRSLFTGALLLIAGMAVQAYDVNDPRYNPYAVPNKPFQPYQAPTYNSPSQSELVEKSMYPYGRPDTSQMTPTWQANRIQAINACNMIWGNPAAQRDCFRGIP